MPIIDTHAHLYLKQFKQDTDEVIQQAKANGVESVFLPNIDMQSIEPMLALSKKYPAYCYALLGLHPCSVKEDFEQVLEKMKPMFQKNNFYGVGETGLDYHWDVTYKDQQKEALKIQVEWANELKLPIILHTRKSFEDTYEIIAKNKTDDLTGIFHCFGGSASDAQKVIDIGFYIGIGGVVTYKNSGLEETLKHVSLDKILIETDSPYLSPVPKRGKRNEPAYTKWVVEKIADIKNISVEEVELETTLAAKKLYQIG